MSWELNFTDGDGTADSPALASYEYNGRGRIVVEDYEQPDVRLDYWHQAAGTYGGFDRSRLRPAGFGGHVGRVVDQKWQDDSSTVKDRFQYTYDRGSNRLTRDLTLTGGLDVPLSTLPSGGCPRPDMIRGQCGSLPPSPWGAFAGYLSPVTVACEHFRTLPAAAW